MWPPELRADLRGGLRAKHRGDQVAAEEHLRRAWTWTKATHNAMFAPEAYLKTSGVAICLADILERSGKMDAAYDVYTEAVEHAPNSPSGLEHMRIAAIAFRLGELAPVLLKTAKAEEKWLTMAVERTLQVITGPRPKSENPDAQTVALELDLPTWVSKTDAAAPLEALGTFYADAGKLELAMPLYLHATTILIPPPPQVSSTEDRCRGAQVMLSLSELIMRREPTAQVRHQAEAWAAKGLDILADAAKRPKEDGSICDYALAAALFNMGVLREMAGDKSAAREFYVLGARQARTVGMQEGAREAEDALRRLDSGNSDEVAAI
ncbi:hypothetical protein BD779DRAFT_507254 [Infundibulicybe gibba]|nr:hypothetical protein BD779DRAFT_507254 [Infundibulicybe gibba]